MAQFEITVPQSLKEWVDAQVSSGRYNDASDYVRDLIRRDQAADELLIDALEEGVASGRSDRTLEDIWTSAKAKAGHR